MKSLLRFVVLPAEITEFERLYLLRVNRAALVFFAMHVPLFAIIAWLNHTGPGLAALLACAVLAGPAIASRALPNPRHVSMVHGVAAMFFGGLLVHFGQGPTQIEMHFYFFALVAMCAVFGNPMVIIAAAVTVALHHLVVWLVLPRSVFNYDASWWVVAVHAAFVVLESVATCFIARSFFDNVIGLDRIVKARTAELDARNGDMRLLLDNVQQGFLTIDRRGGLAAERSAAVDRWLGTPSPDGSWFDYLEKTSPEFARRTRLGWSEVVDAIMPMELTLEQMPHRLTVNGAHLRVEYRPIGSAEPFDHCLVIVTDMTTEVERELAELERREAMAVFERVLVDRSGFETFFEEGGNIVAVLTTGVTADPAVVKRLLHTLKGNAALFELTSIAEICHRLEDLMADAGAIPSPDDYQGLRERWARLATDIEKLLGRRARFIEIDEAQYAALESAVIAGRSRSALLEEVRSLRLEPTAKRLGHFAEQARRIAQRLDRGHVSVRVDDGGVRLDPERWTPFWSTFIHAVRNALDHGIEPREARLAAGKDGEGTLVLHTSEDRNGVVVEIRDDGRGVDWNAVAERARRSGLPAETPDDLRRALFVDGVSTASTVTDLSGRGIGMGALLHGTRALGGELTVDSKPGAGTTLRMTFPVSAKTQPDALAPAA